MPIYVEGQLVEAPRPFKTRQGEDRVTASLAEMGATHQVSLAPELAGALRNAVGRTVRIPCRMVAIAKEGRALVIFNALAAPQVSPNGA